MNKNITKFKEEAFNIANYFPELSYMETADGIPCLIGELLLHDKEGFYIDRYSIRIEPTPNYPFQFPHVYETGGRLPHNIDWHVFPDGHCCIKSMPEESIICKQGINLKQFLEKEVMPYFFNQKYREMYGFYLKERSHGIQGNIEYFKDLFKTDNLRLIANGLSFIKKRKEPTRVSKCFCGSGLKYRKCHKEVYRILNSFADNELDFYVRMINSSLEY